MCGCVVVYVYTDFSPFPPLSFQWRAMRRPHFYFPRYSQGLTPLHDTGCGSSGAGAGAREKPLFGSAVEEEKLRHEACTGKIYLTGFDRHHRPVVVFDNAVQNTKNTAHNLDLLVSLWRIAHGMRPVLCVPFMPSPPSCLSYANPLFPLPLPATQAFSLEMATLTMPRDRDKYVVFMHLDQFSFLNCPDLSTTKETALMLTTAFPERLGHCVCYHPPRIFHTVFALLKRLGLLDERTTSKVILIYGDSAPGTANDTLLTDVIGPHWRQLVGIDQPVHASGACPVCRMCSER